MADKKVKEEIKEEAPKVQPEDEMPDIPQAAAAEPVAVPTQGETPNVPASSEAQTNEAQSVPEQAPEAAPVTVEKTPQQEAQERFQHDMQFADDLKYGAVQPKTYHDLYAEKSLPGKIGTIFGLMLAGAGSGLTHQPNALLEMMNKQIERDFEAQKANQQNKESWYHYSLQHELQQPDVAKKWSEAQRLGYENQQYGITDNAVTASGVNRQTAGVLNDLQHNINMLPPGPNKDAAQAQFNNVTVPFFMQKASDRQQNAAGKNAAIQTTLPVNKPNPPPTKTGAKPGVKYDAINEQAFNKAIQKGKFAPLAPDAIPPALLSEVNKEKEDLVVNRNNLSDADDSFQALAKLKNAGQAPGIKNASNLITALAGGVGLLAAGPVGGAIAGGVGKLATAIPGETLQQYFERNRSIQMEALKGRLGGGMSEEDKNKLANAMLPSWADDASSIKEAHRKMIQHFESNPAEVAPNLTRLGLKYPMPKYIFESKEKKKPKGASGDY